MSPNATISDLGVRECEILKALVREHVQTGKPVGSRRLSRLHEEGLSSATIRNVVSDLEEAGYLTQPHTSAGRIPTARGYRFYVDSITSGRSLSTQDVKLIRKSLEQEADPGELMDKTSKILSLFSSNLGFVLAPPLSGIVIKMIEFVRIAAGRILVIVVSQTGQLQHRMIRIEEDLKQDDLDRAGRYLVTHFSGNSLTEMRDELLSLMTEEKALYDRLLKNVILLGSAGLMAHAEPEEESAEIYLGGTEGIIKQPELADVDRMTVLFQTFEEKSRVVKILSECLNSDHSRPVVTIGVDDVMPGMGDWTVISSPYSCNQQIVGGLGIIGPSRMEYERAIGLVDYVAKLFGRLISHQQ